MSNVSKTNSKPNTHSKEHCHTNSSNILHLSSGHILHMDNEMYTQQQIKIVPSGLKNNAH